MDTIAKKRRMEARLKKMAAEKDAMATQIKATSNQHEKLKLLIQAARKRAAFARLFAKFQDAYILPSLNKVTAI